MVCPLLPTLLLPLVKKFRVSRTCLMSWTRWTRTHEGREGVLARERAQLQSPTAMPSMLPPSPTMMASLISPMRLRLNNSVLRPGLGIRHDAPKLNFMMWDPSYWLKYMDRVRLFFLKKKKTLPPLPG